MIRKVIITPILLITLIVITSCSTSKNIPSEINNNVEIYFCPRDNCEQRFIDFIESAKFSLHCALFDLKLENVINTLAEKSKTIDVKIVIDNENNKSQLKGAGVRADTSNQLSHNKFCIKDKKVVWTGSFNPTERGAYHNNNNILVFYSKYLVQNYEQEFDELWAGNFGEGGRVKYPVIILNNIKIENYFCPDDDCAYHVVNKIKNAKKSVYFMTFAFTSEPIADALLFNKNIEIKGVFEKSQRSEYSQYERLKGFGLDVKFDNNKANMHHKVFMIDNKTVITGSFNPTKAGDTRNDENIIIIHDANIAKIYLEEFKYVWNIP